MNTTVQLLHGDCIVEMEALARAGRTFDSIVTDPPYGWSFMNRAWDSPDNVAFRADTWRLALQLLPPGGMLAAFGGAKSHHRLMCAVEDAGFELRDVCMWLHGQGFPKSKSLLKPAYEPIILARKPGPLRVLNIDDCRIEGAKPQRGERVTSLGFMNDDSWKPKPVMAADNVGRWPANILHDGEPEVLEAFAAFGGRKSNWTNRDAAPSLGPVYGDDLRNRTGQHYADTGTAARFFYCAKASKSERGGSKHPCIKPQALLRWVVRLIAPPGGTVLDPFAGAGSTGLACLAEGRSAVLVELEAEHIDDARRRLGLLETA